MDLTFTHNAKQLEEDIFLDYCTKIPTNIVTITLFLNPFVRLVVIVILLVYNKVTLLFKRGIEKNDREVKYE